MPAVRQIVANILRVDHAGEFGAIRIYKAQQRLAAWRAPELAAFLDHALEDECRHREAFERLMRERGITPCRTLAIWGVGGSLLGFWTGLLGRSAILVCTAAVERTVHRHLNDQVRWLYGRDAAAAAAISAIQIEELEHLAFAESGSADSGESRSASALDASIAMATEALIWLSTYGASARVAAQMRSVSGSDS